MRFVTESLNDAKEAYARHLKDSRALEPQLLESLFGPPREPLFSGRGVRKLRCWGGCGRHHRSRKGRFLNIDLWRIQLPHPSVKGELLVTLIPLCRSCQKKQRAALWPEKELRYDAAGYHFQFPIQGGAQ